MARMKKFVFDQAAYEKFKPSLPECVRDECFVWASVSYSVAKALFLAKILNLPLMNIPVKDWAKQFGMDGPKDETGTRFNLLNGVTDRDALAANVNYSIPLIFVEHSWGVRNRRTTSLLIDGNKRLRKAFLEGVEKVQGFLIPKAATLSIRE